MKKGILFILIFLGSNLLFSQIERADKYFKTGHYKEASFWYEKSLLKETDPTQKVEIYNKLAESYFRLRDFNNSLKYYSKLIELDDKIDSASLYKYIDVKRNFCDYDIEKNFANRFPEDFYVNKILWAKQHKDIDDNVVIDKTDLLERYSNNIGMGYTFFSDSMLILSINTEVCDDKTTFHDLSVLNLKNHQVFNKLRIPNSNNFYRAYPSYSPKLQRIFFSSNSTKETKYRNNKRKKVHSNDGRNTLHLFYVDGVNIGVLNDKLPEPIPLDFNDYDYNYTHPNINNDGNILFFVSDMPGGFGGYDVYFSLRKGDSWSPPKNCGPIVNTQYDELTPFLYENSLYFSSYGHKNYGGSDVFKVSVDVNNMTFIDCENLGLPINSCADDFSFVYKEDIEAFYLTSNRDSYSGHDEIYIVRFMPKVYSIVDSKTRNFISDVKVKVQGGELTNPIELTSDDKGKWSSNEVENASYITLDHPSYLPKKIEITNLNEDEIDSLLNKVLLAQHVLKGKVIDGISNEPLGDVLVNLYLKSDDGNWILEEQINTDDEGEWSFQTRRDKTYKVEIVKDKYDKKNIIIPAKSNNEKGYLSALNKLNPLSINMKAEKGNEVKINNIYFASNKATISQESFQILDNLFLFLKNNPNARIELSAHSDCIGSASYNLNLSRLRAKACYDYLIKKGINKTRIVPVGYGETKQINTDCERQKKDDEYAKKNRRVEVKIL